MLRSKILGGFVVLLAAACGSEGEVQQPIASTEAVQPRTALRPGDVHRYEFAWTVESGGEVAMVGGAHITGDIALSGELAVEVLADDGDAFVLGVRFTRLDEAVLAMTGHNVLPSPQQLLGHQGVLAAPRDGRPRELRIDPKAPPVFRTLLEGFLVHVDLSVPPPKGASRTEVGPTGNGLAQLQYRWSPTERNVVEREIVGYERVDVLRGGPRGPQWDVDGRARIELGDDALVETVATSEVLTLAHAEDPFDFGAATSFSMHRTAVERGPGHAPPLSPDIDTWPARDLFEAPDYTEADRVLAQSFAEGLTTTEVIIAVQSAGRGLPPPKGFLVRARGLLRGWPELARELVYVFEQDPDPVTRRLALDLLVSADTPQAQDVIVDVIGELDDARDPDLAGDLQHLSLLRSPTVELAAVVLDVHDAAVDRGDERLAAAALYPMGALASALLYREPPLAELMIDRIRSRLLTATDDVAIEAGLAGLGNLGLAEDADRVLAHRNHANPSVRMQVASSLRRMDTEAATDALYEMLSDRTRDVAAASLSVIDSYRESEADLHRVATMAIAGDVHAGLDGPVVSLLAKRGLDDELAREALVVLHERTADPRTRSRIAGILDLETQ